MMNAQVLADGLLDNSNNLPADEAEAAQALAAAYGIFATDAETNTIPINPAVIPAAQAAMQSALSGISATGAGPTVFPAAIAAFWATIAASFAVAWPGSTAAVPPPHSGFSSALASVAAANTSGMLSREDATSNIADLMHSLATAGGTVTFPPGVTFPIL